MPLNVQDFIIKPPDIRESAGLVRLQDQMNRNREFEMQKQRQADQDEWKKLNLIQDLTDLSKHQTGSDVANAMGNKQASAILQKYTAAAKTMSPSELMANVQKDMQGTLSGMDAMKNELQVSDEQLKALKTQFPELDISSLAKDHRAEILSRRIKGDETFTNPLEVGQSTFDVSNPEFLSRYTTGNKNLAENIINPKGLEETSVFTGTPDAYTKFVAKVPIWKKPNFQQEALKQGFLQGKGEPALELKSTTIPSDAIPSSNGKPFEVIDEDVLNRFEQDGKMNLELIAATRQKFPTYDNFNDTEKRLAKRNTLHDQIKTLDQSNFHPVENRRPARTTVNVGDIISTAPVNDIYGRIYSETKRLKDYGEEKIKPSLLKGDEQKVIGEFLDNINKGKGEDDKITLDDTWVKLTDQDEVIVMDNSNRLLFTLPKLGVNLKNQANTKGKQKVVQEGEPDKSAKPQQVKPKKDPLGLF